MTDNTPRSPVTPRAGRTVTLWFGSSPVMPGLDLFVVVENAGAPDGEELPRIEKAVLDHHENDNSYWRCLIGPFAADQTIAYFPVANWRNDEVVCGKQYGFQVLPIPADISRLERKEGNNETNDSDLGHGPGGLGLGRGDC